MTLKPLYEILNLFNNISKICLKNDLHLEVAIDNLHNFRD